MEKNQKQNNQKITNYPTIGPKDFSESCCCVSNVIWGVRETSEYFIFSATAWVLSKSKFLKAHVHNLRK